MHVALSDLLVCPRCGPEWGLILVPDEVRGRRVVRGALGCPNCRTRYVIEAGVADLRLEDDGLDAGGEWRPEDGPVRLAALLGLGERGGVVLLAGPAAAHAPALAGLVPDTEVVASSPAGAPARGGASGSTGDGAVSEVALGGALPFRTSSLHGIALTGAASGLVSEAARVLGPGARLLVDPASGAAREAVAASGLRVVAQEGSVLVAVR